ncbi:hypothetical protein [Nocardia wallacei]|uniref:hypothetical protein n=1 Tax=Nocardia wallacei TaxID=480035 RepID=UPI002457307A|nr:hypothetical protein [Nocardia wallacei]
MRRITKAHFVFRRGSIDEWLIDQRREPCPHYFVGPGKRCVERGLIDRSGMDPQAARLPLRDQPLVHPEVGRELSDTHPLGIAEGAGFLA